MITRRKFIQTLGGMALTTASTGHGAAATATAQHQRKIPSANEPVPAVGMGTWLTFDVGDDASLRAQRAQVLQTFLDLGGALVDSSPMYGSAEDVIGWCLKRINDPGRLFSATKVWTVGREIGINEMELSRRLWGVDRFDLMQIHNMLDWDTHIETLKEYRSAGRIRYMGITTSHGRRHEDMEAVMKAQPFDFVQFTYNLVDREAEQRLLPLAAERGIAVIINRPFQGGALFRKLRNRPLPAWAAEFDCANWAQYFLKFIISHPAVTCAIPATTRVDHMRENMGALQGRLPDPELRQRMVRHYETL